MRGIIVLFMVIALGLPVFAEEPLVVGSAGIKTENLRFGGGKVISENPVFVTSGLLEYDSGLYGRFWSTAGMHEYDAELDIGGGFIRPCLGGLRCRAEVTYWVLPELETTEGDAVDFVVEVSGVRNLSDNRSFTYALRLEDLNILGRKDMELYRMSAGYQWPIHDVPVRLWAEYAYNAAPGWSHMPVSLSAKFEPTWLPENVSLSPSLDLLIPLNDADERETGVAFGLTLSRTWR